MTVREKRALMSASTLKMLFVQIIATSFLYSLCKFQHDWPSNFGDILDETAYLLLTKFHKNVFKKFRPEGNAKGHCHGSAQQTTPYLSNYFESEFQTWHEDSRMV